MESLEVGQPIEPKRGDVFMSIARSAFDLASCGMGPYTKILEDYLVGKGLPEGPVFAGWVNTHVSNYLANPYVLAWERTATKPSGLRALFQKKDHLMKMYEPKNLSPNSPNHLKLLQAYRNEYTKIAPGESSPEVLKRAAIYKLAAMLAVTDQLTYDAEKQGVPIPPSFKPEDPDGRIAARWQELIGEPMPTLKEMYLNTHQLFTKLADPEDPVIKYLFQLKDLPLFS